MFNRWSCIVVQPDINLAQKRRHRGVRGYLQLMALALLLFCPHSFAADKILKVAVNIGPPWAFYEESEGVVGIDVDIIKLVATKLGYDTEFHLLAYNRLINDYNTGKYDIASPAAFPSTVGGLSLPYLPFEDVAISLKDKNFQIDSVNDLKGKTIIAYQSARQVLGDAFSNVVNDANYLELAEREIQIKLLANNRTDIVVGERRLLTYIIEKNYPDIDVAVHPVFDTKSYGAIIKDEYLKARFDDKLNEIKQSGEYQAILDKWP